LEHLCISPRVCYTVSNDIFKSLFPNAHPAASVVGVHHFLPLNMSPDRQGPVPNLILHDFELEDSAIHEGDACVFAPSAHRFHLLPPQKTNNHETFMFEYRTYKRNKKSVSDCNVSAILNATSKEGVSIPNSIRV
jgi:hypothetical protein